MEREIAQLTIQLEAAKVSIEHEVERGKRVEAIAVRMEQSALVRQEQLLKFERDLGELSATNTEFRELLRTAIPPAALRGLRSYKNGGDRTAVNGVPGTR